MSGMRRGRDPTDVKIAVYVSKALHAELEAEAWEEERDLSAYIRRLLSSRGKWARTVGTAGGYLARGPANPPKTVRAPKDDEVVPEGLRDRVTEVEK
jgi:hypothetical protein